MLSYLNSKDVADYLRKIDYRFSPMEQAYLVYQSQNHTLEQKKGAWRKIAEEYPNEIYHRKDSPVDNLPFAQVLNDYIAYKDRLVSSCKDPSPGVWEFSYLTEEGGDWDHYLGVDTIRFFSSFERCFKFACACISDGKNIYGTVQKFRITKTPFEGEEFFELTFNVNGELLAAEGLWDCDVATLFYGMWFAIPTPFKRGDIVLAHNYEKRKTSVYVLGEISSWGSKELQENGYADGASLGNGICSYADADAWLRARKREGDSDCMSFSGYTVIEGDLEYCSDDGYLDLEYYRGEEDDDYKLLKVVSEFEKGRVNVELLMKYIQYYKAKSDAFFSKSDAWMASLNFHDILSEDFLFGNKKP